MYHTDYPLLSWSEKDTHKPMKSHNRIFLLTTNTKGTIEKLSQSYLFPTKVKTARNPVVFLFLCRFCILDPRNVHTHSTQRVTITKFANCTFKSKITDLDPSETQSSDASRQDKVQIPNPVFYFIFYLFTSFSYWIVCLFVIYYMNTPLFPFVATRKRYTW